MGSLVYRRGMDEDPTFDELMGAFESPGMSSPFMGRFDDVAGRGVEHMASLVNEGVWSVDDLLRTFDEGLAENPSDPVEREEMLRELGKELRSEADATKVERYLKRLQDQTSLAERAEETG